MSLFNKVIKTFCKTFKMASICNCNDLCVCLPPLPPPLTRQTNKVWADLEEVSLENDSLEHEWCEDAPCAYCLQGWISGLEAIKTSTCEPYKTFQIQFHEKMIKAGMERAELPPPPPLTRQTNEFQVDFQANFQVPSHCLVKNCQVCKPGIAHLLTKKEREQL